MTAPTLVDTSKLRLCLTSSSPLGVSSDTDAGSNLRWCRQLCLDTLQLKIDSDSSNLVYSSFDASLVLCPVSHIWYPIRTKKGQKKRLENNQQKSSSFLSKNRNLDPVQFIEWNPRYTYTIRTALILLIMFFLESYYLWLFKILCSHGWCRESKIHYTLAHE